jgi:lactoylglutathione lyase
MPISSFTLPVIKSSRVERLVDFYRLVGLKFEQHQHGVGPVHFTATIGDVVFEIPPGTKSISETTNVRFVFSTDTLDYLMREVNQAGGTILSEPVESPWDLRAVIADPDGNKVEFSQQNN